MMVERQDKKHQPREGSRDIEDGIIISIYPDYCLYYLGKAE